MLSGRSPQLALVLLLVLFCFTPFRLSLAQDNYVAAMDTTATSSNGLGGATSNNTTQNGDTVQGKNQSLQWRATINGQDLQPIPSIIVRGNDGIGGAYYIRGYLQSWTPGPYYFTAGTTFALGGSTVAANGTDLRAMSTMPFKVFVASYNGNQTDLTFSTTWLLEMRETSSTSSPLIDSVLVTLNHTGIHTFSGSASSATPLSTWVTRPQIEMLFDPSGGHPGAESAPEQEMIFNSVVENYSATDVTVDFQGDSGSGAIFHSVIIPAGQYGVVVTSTFTAPPGTLITPVIDHVEWNGIYQSSQGQPPYSAHQPGQGQGPNGESVYTWGTQVGTPPAGDSYQVRVNVTRNFYSDPSATVSLSFMGSELPMLVAKSPAEPPVTSTYDFTVVAGLGASPIAPSVVVDSPRYASFTSGPEVPNKALLNIYDVYVYDNANETSQPLLIQTTHTTDPTTGNQTNATYTWTSPTTGTQYTWATSGNGFDSQATIDNGSTGTVTIPGSSTPGTVLTDIDVGQATPIDNTLDLAGQETSLASKAQAVTVKIETWRDAWLAVLGSDDPTTLGKATTWTMAIPSTHYFPSVSFDQDLSSGLWPVFRLVLLVAFGITVIPFFLRMLETLVK